jgi:hypothetical protein
MDVASLCPFYNRKDTTPAMRAAIRSEFMTVSNVRRKKNCHKGTKTQSETFSLYLSSRLCVLVAKLFFQKMQRIHK